MSNRTVIPPLSRNVQSPTHRVAVAVGLGYLLLVVVPVTTVSLLLMGAGYRLVGFGLLGVSLGVTVFSLLVVGLVWLLVSSVVQTLLSFFTLQRRRVLFWAEDLEAAHWWARLVGPSDRLAFLDHRSDQERLDDSLDRLRAQYVSGELSEMEFERGLDRLLGTTSLFGVLDDVDAPRTMTVSKDAGGYHDPLDAERLIR